MIPGLGHLHGSTVADVSPSTSTQEAGGLKAFTLNHYTSVVPLPVGVFPLYSQCKYKGVLHHQRLKRISSADAAVVNRAHSPQTPQTP
jgi:hypothetical protein